MILVQVIVKKQYKFIKQIGFNFPLSGTCYRQLDPESREIWHRIRHEWEDIECYGYADNYSFREMRENPADCFVAHNCYIPEFGKDDRNGKKTNTISKLFPQKKRHPWLH